MLRKLHGNPWAILTLLSLGFFMTLLDLTIVNIAIPDMTDSLDASLDDILWVVNAYTLGLAVLLITGGRLGDLQGKKNLFMLGVAVFTLASLACGLAQNPEQLIAFRAVQGLGAALLMPQTLSMIVEVFPAEKRGVALGIWGAVAGVSAVAGPTLGGLLVTQLDWRWIFFLNIPIGVLVLVCAGPIMPNLKRQVRHRFDITGVIIASLGLGLLAFGLTEGERYDWNGLVWGLIAGGVVVLGVFLVYERGQQEDDPLLPFSLFRDRGFSIINFVGVAVSFGVIGLYLPITIYLQSVLEFSAMKTGGVLVPMALGAMFMAGPAGILSEKIGAKYILMSGLLAFGSGIVWILSVADADSSWTVFLAPLFLIGLGAGCTFTPMASEVMRNVPPRLTGAASGVNNALRQVGSVMAGAIIGAVLQAQLATQLVEQAEEEATALPADLQDPFVAGFAEAGENGLDVGTEQAGAAVPEGVPQEVADQLENAAGAVFGQGFIDAMMPTMMVSAGVLLLGALACLALKSHSGPAANPHGLPVSDEDAEPATVSHG